MLYVGLDVHTSRSSLCILNDAGAVVNRQEIKGRWPKLLEAVKGIDQPLSLCYEASCGYGFLYDRIRPLAAHVAVAHPGKLRLIYRSKRKNDRFDAEKLAKLLLLDMVPKVHVPKVNVRNWRGLITWRQRLMEKRVSCKNLIRSALREMGVESPAGKSLWTRKSIAWLKELSEEQLGPVGTLKVQMALDELESLSQRIGRVEKELAKVSDTHSGVALLRTIPGVGIRTAEASWMAIRLCPATRAFFERVMGDKPDRKKIALVATAHRLVRVMGAMLRSGEVYRPDRTSRGKSGRGEENPIGPQAVLSAPPTPTPPLSGFPSSGKSGARVG